MRPQVRVRINCQNAWKRNIMFQMQKSLRGTTLRASWKILPRTSTSPILSKRSRQRVNRSGSLLLACSQASLNQNSKGFLGFFLFMYVIQHCFFCRPSDSIVSEDAGIEPRTVPTLAIVSQTLSNHSARSHPLGTVVMRKVWTRLLPHIRSPDSRRLFWFRIRFSVGSNLRVMIDIESPLS